MTKDSVITFNNPAENIVEDALTQYIRAKAQEMIKVAVEAEVEAFIEAHSQLKLPSGQQRVVRNGYLPERAIQTGIGKVRVKMPRLRDRGDDGQIIFQSSLVPQYMRRTATLDVLLPLMYLKGISTGDFQATLEPLLGPDAKNLSRNVINRLKASWYDDFEAWQQRDLTDKRYVYWWVDGVYLKARMEDEKQCMLVIVGADSEGQKELVALVDGYRESKQSWQDVLMQLKSQGLYHAPQIVVGDGALGFWGALNEVFSATKQQRCWVHKTSNVLDKLPKSQQEKAKKMLHDIYLAATREDALKAWDDFINCYNLKYPKATDCL